MSPAQHGRRASFALRLEHGLGRLVMGERTVDDLFTIDELHLGLEEVPSRLDMSAGVDRFRHHRGRLEQLAVHADDHDIGRALRRAARDTALRDLEVRALDGDLVVLGEIAGEPNAPFVARARLEAAGIGRERALLVSFYELRVFGAARITAAQLATSLLRAFGLEDRRVGPTVAVFDPVDRLLLEVCAEIGWKLPGRDDVRLLDVGCSAGRVHLSAGRRIDAGIGPRGLRGAAESSARVRGFLADYEAKSLYASIEALIDEGRLEAATAAYERQLEVHPGHPFLVARLLQLFVARPETVGDAAALARSRLQLHPDDRDAQIALAVVHARRDQPDAAADAFERIARDASDRADAIEAAQAWCAAAALLAERDAPRAIQALERALALRRRLPGALRALADLHARVGDWAAALRVRERLLSGEADAGERRRLLVELGQMALERADDPDAARAYFERALEAVPDDISALTGLAEAQEKAGRPLPAVRSLDRAAQVLQDRGDAQAAAAAMVRLGDLWRRVPDGDVSTAGLRYRQALMIAPGTPGALFGLAECAVSEGDPLRARGHLEELLRVADDAAAVDRGEVYLRLGRLLSGALGDIPLAVSYFQKALSLGGAQADAAVDALCAVHAEAERWDDLARVLEVSADRAPDEATRGDRLARLATVVHARLGDARRADTLLAEAYANRRGDIAILEQRAALHRSTGDRSALADCLETLASELADAEQLAAVYAERGDLLRIHLNRTDDSVEAYTLALGCDPAHRDGLEGLADIYRERERFGELASLLERLAQVEPDEGRAARAWLELGRLQADLLERPRAARKSFEHVLDTLSDDTEALRRLGDLLFEGGDPAAALPRYELLREIYDREGYDEPTAPFLVRLAEVLDALERADDAVRTLAAAAAADPDRAATYEQAQDVMLRDGDVAGIVEFFTRGLEEAVKPATRAFLSRRVGRLLWRELRRPEDAAPLLDEAMRLAPDDGVRKMRLEVATALADWPRVADLLRGQLDGARREERPALLTNLADLAYRHLERPEEGAQLARAALEEAPNYAPALTLMADQAYAASDWLVALEAYGRLVETEGEDARDEDKTRLAEVLKRVEANAEKLPSTGPPSEIEAERAEVTTPPPTEAPPEPEPELDESDEAVEAVAEVEESLLEVAAELASQPEAEAPPEATTEPELELPETPIPGTGAADAELIRLEEAAVQADKASQGAAWLAVAEHQRDELSDPDGAIPVFETVLERAVAGDPAYLEAMEAIEDLHAVHGRWDGLIGLYDRRLADGVGVPAEVQLLKASILRAAGRMDQAITAAELALESGERATDLLVSLLADAGRHEDAANHLLADLDRLSPEEAGYRRWRAADMLADVDPLRALELLEAAHATVSDPMLVEEWATLARIEEAPKSLVAALEAQAASHSGGGVDAVRRSGLLLEASRHATDPQKTQDLLEASLDAWSENIDALTALEKVLTLVGDDFALAGVLEKQIEASLPGPHRAELEARLAALRDSEAPAPVAEEPAGEAGPIERARAALASIGDAARRVELNRVRRELDALIDGTNEQDPAHAGLLALRGELWRGRLGHVERARADLEAAARLAPDTPQASLSLGFIAMDRADPERAARHLQHALSAPDGPLGPLSDDQARTAFATFSRALDRLGLAGEVPARAAAILEARPDCAPAQEALDRG